MTGAGADVNAAPATPWEVAVEMAACGRLIMEAKVVGWQAVWYGCDDDGQIDADGYQWCFSAVSMDDAVLGLWVLVKPIIETAEGD